MMDNTNWRAMFPNEKHELLVGCTEDKTEGRAAQKDGAAGCEKGRGGLQKRAALAAENGSPLDCPFPHPSLMCSPPACFSMQVATLWIIHVFHLATRPAGLPFSVIR